MRRWRVVTAVVAGLIAGACAGPVVEVVADGSYRALVPTAEQFTVDAEGVIPGGFSQLRASGANGISIRVRGDAVTFALDGQDVLTRRVVERFDVVDREGSGPFKAQKEVLSLDVDPEGSYENVNNPALNQSPVASITITAEDIELTMNAGDVVRIPRDGATSTRACGLAESPVWSVPAEVGLPVVDPVLVFTPCPTNPGSSVELIMTDRAAIPVLALEPSQADGAWCEASTTCLWFAPM